MAVKVGNASMRKRVGRMGWRLSPWGTAVPAWPALVLALLGACVGERQDGETGRTGPEPESGAVGSVIFIHPDGTSTAHWTACRLLYAGPDSSIHWDRLPSMALYRGHMKDGLTSTSHGGATVHAYGERVSADSYGQDGRDPVRRSGAGGGGSASPKIPEAAAGQDRKMGVSSDGTVPGTRAVSILREALDRGLHAGIVNSGTITEPGTGCFAACVDERSDHAGIVDGILSTAPHVIFGGGEGWFLPEGVEGRHGPGRREDGRNCISWAESLGYRVIYTREELLSLPAETERVLGLFAWDDTYNDTSEETLREEGLPPYDPEAPTIAEMTEAALRVLGGRQERFFLVVEEEGTDNFGNSNNARDCILAVKRADEAIGVARRFLAGNPRTLLVTAADSDAGGLAVVGLYAGTDPEEPLPERDGNGAPWDGRDGTGTPPFVAMPDERGVRLPFAVAWAGYGDLSGGVLARAEGLNSEMLSGNVDNVGIYELMHRTLFGR